MVDSRGYADHYTLKSVIFRIMPRKVTPFSKVSNGRTGPTTLGRHQDIWVERG
jgi:hypothetical protein